MPGAGVDMARVRLIHWNEDEGLERRKQLEAFGFEAAFDFGEGLSFTMRQLRGDHPDAVVIDLSRLPYHGREVARTIRGALVPDQFQRFSAATALKTLAKRDNRRTMVLMSSSPRATWIHHSLPSS